MRIRSLLTSISNSIVTWSTNWQHVFGAVSFGAVTYTGAIGTLQTASITGAAQTVTPAVGNSVVLITAATNDAFTVALPSGTAAVGMRIVILVANAVGGAMGAITFNAGYFFSAWTSPANGTRRAIEFIYDGTAWNQVSPAGVDIS